MHWRLLRFHWAIDVFGSVFTDGEPGLWPLQLEHAVDMSTHVTGFPFHVGEKPSPACQKGEKRKQTERKSSNRVCSNQQKIDIGVLAHMPVLQHDCSERQSKITY
jgi:hypothetical protein